METNSKLLLFFPIGKTFINKIGLLGLTLNTIPNDFPRPVIGQAYTGEEYSKFKSEIRQFPNLEQPGHSIIFGHKVFIWVYENAINISISGTKDNNRYEVTQNDFEVCLELEKHFENLGWLNIIDKSLEKSVCCISQTKYPELYGDK